LGARMEVKEMISATSTGERQDMRRSQRHKINLHVMVSTLVRGINKLIPAYGRNLGEGGMCVFVPAQLSLGDVVDLAVQFPGAETKTVVRGRIRGVERFNYSIEFTSVDERTRQLIADSCQLLLGGTL
jgi:PilZ domain